MQWVPFSLYLFSYSFAISLFTISFIHTAISFLWYIRCFVSSALSHSISSFKWIRALSLSLSLVDSLSLDVFYIMWKHESPSQIGMAIYYIIMLEFKWLHWVTNMKTFAYIPAKLRLKPKETHITCSTFISYNDCWSQAKKGSQKSFSSYDCVCCMYCNIYFIISATLSNSSQKPNCFHSLSFDDFSQFFAWVSFSRL